MKIAVNKDIIEFHENLNKNWNASYSFSNFDVHFSFDELIFKNQENNEIVIDWNLIENFINHIIKNIEKINTQGSELLEQLRIKSHFYDEKILNGGHFEIDEIILKDFTKNEYINNMNQDKYIQYNFMYDVSFFYEHIETYLSSNHYSYTAKFSNHQGFCIIGVSNDVWDLYKSK